MNRDNLKIQNKTFSKKLWASIVLTALALCASAMAVKAATEVPFIVSAYTAVQKDPAKAGISATVTMTTLNASSKGPKVLVAQGPLAMEGDLLGARLPMSFDKSESLPEGRHMLLFNVTKTGRIGLQWLIDGEPRGGTSMQAFDTDASGSTLTKKLTWQGEYRLVTVEIQRKLTFVPGPLILVRPTPKPIFRPGKVVILKPTPTPTPKLVFKPGRLVVIKPKPKTPIGRRVKVTGRFVVTNSDDGVGGIFGNADKRVEMSGYINFGNQTAFSFSSRAADDGNEFKSKAMNSVVLNYSDPNHRFFSIKGNIRDVDTASASDTLWLASQNVDLLSIMQSNKEYLIKGDRNSESGDLYLRVTDEGEVF